MVACPAHLIAPGLPGWLGVNSSFSLASFMASQSDGLYFDFTKTDRLFQESTGPTPAQATNDVIGLALDQRTWRGQTLAQVVAAATGLLIAGSWTMSAGGTATATESPAGTLNLTGDGTNSARGEQSFATVANAVYALTYNSSSAANTLKIGPTQGSNSILQRAPVSGGETIYFVATGTTTWVRFERTTASLGTVSAISCKKAAPYAATQSTSSLRPTFQTSGAKFDGSDDNLLTGYLAGSGANFIVALVTVPASIASFQYIFGANEASNVNRFGIGINTDGKTGFGVGGTSPTVAKGTSDIRGLELTLGISSDGTNVAGFVAGSQEYTAALTGAFTTSTAIRLGAVNNAGTASAFFGGSIKRIVAGRQALDLPTYLKIRSALLAA